MLNGLDYIWNFFDGKAILRVELRQHDVVAVFTKVGWVLLGPVENLPREKLSSIQFASTCLLRVDCRGTDDDLQKDLQRLWDLDSVGIRDKHTVSEAFEKDLSFKDGKLVFCKDDK